MEAYNKKVEKRMLNLKKTAAAVLALSSSAVFAGTMGPVCSAVNVTVPCESTAWDVGARALYLQPTYAGDAYGYLTTNNQGRAGKYNKNWGWGFMIEGSYHFETGSDANLNWYHYDKASTQGYTVPQGGSLSNTLGYPVQTTQPTSGAFAASVKSVPKWDAVNLEFGQHVDVGEKKAFRFHGGVQYARVANQVNIYANASGTGNSMRGPVTTINGTDNVDYTLTFKRKPTFNGFGPRVGADLGYDFGYGLGIYANGAGALLAGSSKVSSIYYSTGVVSGDTTPRSFNQSASRPAVVPELEAKLGLSYDYAVAQGDLTLDVGWMWLNYFNATQSISPSTTPSSGDFGLQGLYFGLKWMGNVA